MAFMYREQTRYDSNVMHGRHDMVFTLFIFGIRLPS